jgi:hypothetical protein
VPHLLLISRQAEALKGALGLEGVIGNFAEPYQAGTAYVLLHHAFSEVKGRAGDTETPQWVDYRYEVRLPMACHRVWQDGGVSRTMGPPALKRSGGIITVIYNWNVYE